jgi:hypothetical protein
MSWVIVASIALLITAIVLIEARALRTGDERRHHAPGYALTMGGVVLIGIGISAAILELVVVALIASAAGLLSVVLGATRHPQAPAH